MVVLGWFLERVGKVVLYCSWMEWLGRILKPYHDGNAMLFCWFLGYEKDGKVSNLNLRIHGYFETRQIVAEQQEALKDRG